MESVKKYTIVSLHFLIFLTLSVAFSTCNNSIERKNYELCGCFGQKEVKINQEGAIVALTLDGYHIISIDHGIMTPCSPIPTEFQKDGQLALISGRVIPTCFRDYLGYGFQTLVFETHSIERIDTLFQTGTLTIKLIKTEDFGLPMGFGYEITNTAKNFFIRQTHVQAHPGGPFKTPADALKTAFLVAHKLKTKNDFPSAYIGELYFLKVSDGQ